MILEGDVVPNHLQEVVADVIESPAHPQASPPALDEHNRPKISFGRKPAEHASTHTLHLHTVQGARFPMKHVEPQAPPWQLASS